MDEENDIETVFTHQEEASIAIDYKFDTKYSLSQQEKGNWYSKKTSNHLKKFSSVKKIIIF